MAETMPNWLKKRAELSPDRVALIFEEHAYTYQQVFEKAKWYAGKLEALGLKKGGTAAVLFSNQAEAVFILYALQMAGIRVVILNHRLTAEELVWQLDDSQATVLVYETRFNGKVSEVPANARKISTKDLLETNGITPFILDEYELNEVTSIMYTSGTTGNPKGVMQTYGNHWWSTNASALNLGLHVHDKWLCTVPIFHISGYSILMRGQIYGMPIVLHSSFDEKKVLEDIGRYDITILSVVSTMLRRIIDRMGENKLPDSFRCMLLGGGPATLPLLQACLEKEIPVFQTYGMTETSSQVVTLSPEYSMERLGSAGKALFPNQIQIVNDAGEIVPPGAEGEIIVKGPNVTAGYLNRPEETADKIRDSWLYTGDIGYIDDQGFLYVLDRRSDLIISGGENVYPAEIEGVLQSLPGVADAGVIGMSDEQWGQMPVAFIVKKESGLRGEDLFAFCERKLAKYKVPKKVYFVDRLPRNAAKKLLRRTLREWLEAERDESEH